MSDISSKINVIYEDNHIIVVEKPVNIPSQGDKTGDIDMLTLIKEYIKEKSFSTKMKSKAVIFRYFSCIFYILKKNQY